MAAGDPAPFDPVAFLAAHGIAGEAGPVRATGGADTEVWRVATPLGLVAVRAFRAGEASRAAREAAAMAAARRAGVPVPPTWLRGAWHGRPVAVIGWVPGRTILEALRVAPWRVWQLGVAFGEAQARLHRVAAPPAMPGPEAWIDRMNWGDRDAVGAPWPTSGVRVRDAPHAYAATAPRALLHLDFRPANVMVDAAGRVTGVIDWVNAVAGPPAADLARTWAIFATAPVPPGWGPPRRARCCACWCPHGFLATGGPVVRSPGGVRWRRGWRGRRVGSPPRRSAEKGRAPQSRCRRGDGWRRGKPEGVFGTCPRGARVRWW